MGDKGAPVPSFHSPAAVAPIVATLAILALGCGQGAGSSGSGAAPPGPPTEKWTEVATDAAPFLANPEEEFPPPQILRRGELLRVGASVRPATWKGMVDDVEVKREGMVFRAQRSKEGTSAFAFQSDLGGEVTVSATSWLCGELAKQSMFQTASCAAQILRARAPDGAIVSHVPCGYGVCPIAVERDGKVASIGVDGLTVARFVAGKKKAVLVIERRWVKDDGKISGSAVSIVTLDGAPVLGEPFSGDEIDSRDPDHVISKVVKIDATRAGVRVTGKRDEVGPNGKILASQPIDETHPLPPLD